MADKSKKLHSIVVTATLSFLVALCLSYQIDSAGVRPCRKLAHTDQLINAVAAAAYSELDQVPRNDDRLKVLLQFMEELQAIEKTQIGECLGLPSAKVTDGIAI